MKIDYKAANLRGLGSDFQLKPGGNDVPDEVWKKWSKHSEIQRLVSEGVIVELGTRAKPGPKPKIKDEGGPDAAEQARLKAELEKALADKQ